MKKLALTALVSLLLGLLAYSAIFLWQKGRIDQKHAHATAAEWLGSEFELDAAQRQRIATLHRKYFPECEDHCVHYTDTRHTLATITDDPDLDNSPEHVLAAKKLTDLEKEADKRFIDFVYKVAAEMNPAQSKRYLQMMKGWLDNTSERGGE